MPVTDTPVLATLVWDTLDSDTLVLATLPLLLSLLSEELTPVLDVMLPTLLELSMSPRERLRLMPSTVLMALATPVWDTLDSDTPVWATAMPVLATLPLPLLLSPQLPPATPTFPPPPLSPPWELPLLPSLLSEQLMLVLDVTSPTLLESFTLLRKIVRKLCFVE